MIVVQETISYHQRAMAIDVTPAIRGLLTKIDVTVQSELRRSRHRLRTLTPDQQQAIRLLMRGIANKILHPAIRCLEQAAQRGDSETIARVCELFGIAPLPLMQARENESRYLPWISQI
ncbi:MAG TPA: hypothetical protein VMU48_18875 [Terracidiphilus sp.]|jgi:glutamyl-tRNA reductase|nr:hypothetical protein [Terracidiphilus sp.]